MRWPLAYGIQGKNLLLGSKMFSTSSCVWTPSPCWWCCSESLWHLTGRGGLSGQALGIIVWAFILCFLMDGDVSKLPITMDRATQLPSQYSHKTMSPNKSFFPWVSLPDVWSHSKKNNYSFPVLPSDPAHPEMHARILERNDKNKLLFGTLVKVKLPSVSIFMSNKAKRKNIQSTEQCGKC